MIIMRNKKDKDFGIAELIFFIGMILSGVGIYMVFSLGITCIFTGFLLLFIGWYKSEPSNKKQ